jgi:hypothetical protein
MDRIHEQVKHRRGSSPSQETVSVPNKRADHRRVEQETREALNTVPLSARTDPEAGVVT